MAKNSIECSVNSRVSRLKFMTVQVFLVDRAVTGVKSHNIWDWVAHDVPSCEIWFLCFIFCIQTDGSAVKDGKSGWGFVAYKNWRVVAKRSGAFVIITSSIPWILKRHLRQPWCFSWCVSWCGSWCFSWCCWDGLTEDDWEDIFFEENGWNCWDSHMWGDLDGIFCPRHAGVHGNELAGEWYVSWTGWNTRQAENGHGRGCNAVLDRPRGGCARTGRSPPPRQRTHM